MANYYVDLDGTISKKKKKKKQNSRTAYTVDFDGNITEVKEEPVKKTVTTSKDKKDERTWFQKSEGNFFETVLGSVGDVFENMGEGIIGMGEKALDSAMSLGASMNESKMMESANNEIMFNAVTGKETDGVLDKYQKIQKDVEKSTAEFVQKDLYDEKKVADKILRAPIKNMGIDTQANSVFGAKSDSLAQSGGQLLATAVLNPVVPWYVTTGATSMGGEVENALKQGATFDKAVASGLITASADILTEKLSGGIKFGGKTLDDAILKPLTEKIANKTVKTLVNLGIDAGGEGFEEVLAGAISNLGTALYKEENVGELLFSEEARDEYIESFIGGAVLGGTVSGIKTVAENSKAKKQAKQPQLTENEQKVVESVVEKRVAEEEADGKKLTDTEKTKIRQEVRTELEKGYIDIDTIESTLGGETFNQYKTMTEEESLLKDKIARLENTKSIKERKQLIEAKEQLEALQKDADRTQRKTQLEEQLHTEVDKLTANDTFLRESYNERTRRGQAFEVDIEQYKGKGKEVVQKAIDSGKMNNTRRSHDFVDFLAKVSTDKGVDFDFTNNEELQKLGLAMDGKTVNGYVEGGNITLNLQSNKALNKVVGHEVTHLFEGTDVHTELVQAVKQYAETKGEWQSRYEALSKLYDGVENVNIENELVADIVGDYLFTDSDFVNKLSVEKPNIFKKVYEEIKYLLKVATAGSKEARELEKVKRAFEKAYKENGVNTGKADVVYSMETTIDDKLYQFAKDSLEGKLPKKSFYKISDTISERMAKDIEEIVGFSVEGYGNEISPNHIRHINDRHGANGKADQSMKDIQDIAKIGYVIDNYDRITEGTINKEYKNSDNSYSKSVVLQKKINDNFYYVVEAVPDSKLKTLHVVSAYINKNDTFPVVDNAKSPIPYAKSEPQSNVPSNGTALNEGVQYSNISNSSKEIVPQNSKNANGNVKPLTKEQQEYFKDSKVRDENGNLKVMYHGTSNGGHTVFDPYGASKFGLFGAGSYFTDNKSVAESYTEKGKGSNKQIYETYLNITNPLDMDAQADAEAWKKAFPDADFPTEGTNEQFFKEMKQVFNDEEYPRWEAMETAMEVIESMGYDGITHIGGGRFNKADDTRHRVYIAFHSEQIKSITNENPTDNPDINLSLSEQGQQTAPTGKWNVYGKDIMLEQAPVKETAIQETEQSGEVAEMVDEFAPMTEQQAVAREESDFDAFMSIVDGDMPPETEAPIYEDKTEVKNPFDERDIKDVGNRQVKAYMYENPEVKPYFQEEAQNMLFDLRNSVKGEKHIDAQLLYDSNGESGIWATKRQTAEEIAYLLDNFSYSYADIEKGLNAIIEDNGKENNAISKRIEFMLDERLREGHTDMLSGAEIPPNEDYINLLANKQITEYSDEAYNEWVKSLAGIDMVPETEDIAPTKEYEAIEPRPENLDALEKQWAKNKMSRVDTKVKGKTEEQKIAKILDTEPTTESDRNARKWAIFRANVFDKGTPFEDLALKHKNRELMGKWNYTLYSEARAQRLMGNGDAESGVKPLNDIREEVENTGLTREFYEYMYHKHNVDRMKLEERYENTKNKPVFGYSVTAEMSQEIVDQYEFANPKFMDYAQDVYNYQNYLRQQLVDSGVISQETADLWQDMYPHYVPVRRVDSKGNNIDVPLDTGRTGVNAPIKKAVGGNTDILPLFDTMASRTIQTYRATAKNSFGVELKDTLGTTIEKAETNIDEVIDSVDAQEGLLQEGKDGRKPTFTVFEDGERVTFEITEDMYDALKPISDSSMLSKTIKPLNVASNFHRGLLTEYNPVFILTNGIKDIQDILINSQHSAKTYTKIPEAFGQILTKGYWYNEYMNNGGDQNSYFDADTNTFKTENKGLAKILDIPPLSTISKLNNYIETIPRLAEYIASRESGRSVEVSMLDSARVTTNFRAGGDLTKFLNRNGATFLNASVQGAMQQVRNVREAKMNGLKGWANLATKFAVAGLPVYLLNALLWEDDDEYEELSDYVKQNYYIVGKYGDGKFIRIPKGRTVAVIQDAFKQMENLVTGNDEVDLKSFLNLVITNIAPSNPIDSNILAPIIQVKNNQTWYGEDLVPTRLQDLPASEQFDESTDAISKWLGEKLDISPVKINYLLDQYSGGVGDVLLPMLTPEAESGDNSTVGNIIAPFKSKFTADSTMNNQSVSDFYETSEKLTANAKKSGATDKDILKNKYINSVKSDMNELYKQKREIQNSDLSDKEKYAQVREIQSEINALAENGLKTYEGVNIDGVYATVGELHYRLNDENEWQKITDKQLVKQEEVTSGLGIKPSEYWSKKEEYDYAYENPERYAIAKSVGGYETFKTYSKALSELKADKDAEGKSIANSRKEKVANYINGLNAGYGEKIILFKSEYTADDTYNYDIVEYLNGRSDITRAEMETILKELGFKVEADGTVRW